MGRSKAIVAIARKLLVAVWHILTNEVADRHADERSVAASFINLAYKMGRKNLPGGISAKAFARQLAETMAEHAPDRYVANMSKAKRKGRIFIDYLRNERGATAIAPFSTRARDGAPVAWPLDWDELKRVKAASEYGLPRALRAIKRGRKDPWPGYEKARKALPA